MVCWASLVVMLLLVRWRGWCGGVAVVVEDGGGSVRFAICGRKYLLFFRDASQNPVYAALNQSQVTAGTIFDEILVTDSLEEAQKFAEGTWAAKKDKEKEAHEELKKKQKEEEEVSG